MSTAMFDTPYPIAPDDPLADAHAAVSAWVEAAIRWPATTSYHHGGDLKLLPSGQTLLAGKHEATRRFVLAAAIQVNYWDQVLRQTPQLPRNVGYYLIQRQPPSPWNDAYEKRQQAMVVIAKLLRRHLPLTSSDLLTLVRLCDGRNERWGGESLIRPVTVALERFAARSPLDAKLRGVAIRVAAQLRYDVAYRRHLGTRLERLGMAGTPVP